MSRSIQLFLPCLLLLLAPVVLADLAEEEQRLTALRQSIDTEEADLADLEAELETYPGKLSSVRDELAAAEQELAAKEQELADLQEEAGSSPASEVERKISLQEHAVRMAERRVRSENRMLERFTRYRDNLQEDIDAARNNIAQLEERIIQQHRRIEAAENEASEPAEANEAPPQTATPSTPPPEVSAPVSEPESEPEPAAERETAETPEGPPVLSESDYEAFQVAKASMEEVERRVADNQDSAPFYSDLTLSGSDIQDTAFTHLGANQYRADVILPSGRQRFRIDDLRFRVNVSAENAGETYVFIVDGRDRGRLQAKYFKASLLDYVGRNPSRASAGETPDESSSAELVTLESGETIELSEEDAYTLEIAREHRALLDELADEESSGDAPFSELTLSGRRLETTPFEYIGHNRYRAEATVEGGRQIVDINRGSYRIQIPDTDEGEAYLFYVDASQRSRLRLTYYKKAILDYLQ